MKRLFLFLSLLFLPVLVLAETTDRTNTALRSDTVPIRRQTTGAYYNVELENVLKLVTKGDVGLAYVDNKKHNFGSSIDPPPTADSTVFYSIGSLWVKVLDNVATLFVATDVTPGAAVWTPVSGGSGGGTMTGSELVSAIDAQLGGNTWQAGGGTMTNAQVKTAYEANSDTNAFTDAEQAKLAGVASGATANSPDAALRDRATHTGTQPISTIAGLQTALDDKQPTLLNAATLGKITESGGLPLWDGGVWPGGGGGEGDMDKAVYDPANRQLDVYDLSNHTGLLGISSVVGLQPALDTKAPTHNPIFTGTATGLTKAMVGLGSVDNTSDANKPVSTATATALAGKADTNHTQPASTISDSTAAGRSLLTAPDVAAIRILLNTDQVSDTRTPTAHQHPGTDLTGSGATGRALLGAADSAAAGLILGLGTAATLDHGTAIGDLIRITDDGSGGPALPFTLDVSDLQDEQGILGSGGLPGQTSQGGKVLTTDGGAAGWTATDSLAVAYNPTNYTETGATVGGHLAGVDAQIATQTALIANLVAVIENAGLDTSAPVLTRVTPAGAATSSATDSYTVNYTVSDPQGLHGTEPLMYSIGGAAAVAMTSGVNSVLTGFAPNTPTDVVVTAKNAGNMTTTDTTQFTYQTPVLAFSGGSGAFGDVTVGQVSATQQFTLTNSGLATSATLTTTKTGTDPTQFDITLDTCNGQTLAPAASCGVTMAYSPDAAVAHSASLNVGGQSVALSGTGLPAGPVVLLGDPTDYSAETDFTLASNRIYYPSSVNAIASGTLRKGYLYSRGAAAPTCMMLVQNSDGTVLEASNQVAFGTSAGLKEFTFSGTNNIVGGTSYKPSVYCSGSFWTKKSASAATALSYSDQTWPTVPGTVIFTQSTGSSWPVQLYFTD